MEKRPVEAGAGLFYSGFTILPWFRAADLPPAWRCDRCSPPMSLADMSGMLETPAAVVVLAVWTFRRREDVLALSREQTDEGYQLVVTECGRPRTFGFSSLERLVHFQHDMEAFLVRTGWRLADFTPDRRDGDDRRNLPREDNDRRRWWTDVVRDGD